MAGYMQQIQDYPMLADEIALEMADMARTLTDLNAPLDEYFISGICRMLDAPATTPTETLAFTMWARTAVGFLLKRPGGADDGTVKLIDALLGKAIASLEHQTGESGLKYVGLAVSSLTRQ